MKVSSNNEKKKSSRYAPVIGLHRVVRQTEDKSTSTEYKCYKDPSNTKSAQYAVVIYHFDNEGPETLLEFLKKLKSIERGQGVTNGPDKYALVRQVLKGVALTAFENAATEHGNKLLRITRNVCKQSSLRYFHQRRQPVKEEQLRRCASPSSGQ